MVPIRPLARVLTQVLWVAGGSILRATYKAYKETITNTAAGGSLMRRQMLPDEAAKILGLPEHHKINIEQINEAHERLRRINSASNGFAGSPYLVQRIDAAQRILYQELGIKSRDP